MVNLNLKEHCGELINGNDVSIYDGETANVSVSVGFTYSYFYAYLNNVSLGKFRTNSFGVHNSKFRTGANELVLDFFDEEDIQITNLKGVIVRHANMRGVTDINKAFEQLSIKVAKMELAQENQEKKLDAFIKEINNERSGY